MIGHFVNALTPIEEGRVLGVKMCAGTFDIRRDGSRCLISAAYPPEDDDGYLFSEPRLTTWGWGARRLYLEERFDRLCHRFGIERIAVAIRNRILDNQARRVLAQVHAVAV